MREATVETKGIDQKPRRFTEANNAFNGLARRVATKVVVSLGDSASPMHKLRGGLFAHMQHKNKIAAMIKLMAYEYIQANLDFQLSGDFLYYKIWQKVASIYPRSRNNKMPEFLISKALITDIKAKLHLMAFKNPPGNEIFYKEEWAYLSSKFKKPVVYKIGKYKILSFDCSRTIAKISESMQVSADQLVTRPAPPSAVI